MRNFVLFLVIVQGSLLHAQRRSSRLERPSHSARMKSEILKEASAAMRISKQSMSDREVVMALCSIGNMSWRDDSKEISFPEANTDYMSGHFRDFVERKRSEEGAFFHVLKSGVEADDVFAKFRRVQNERIADGTLTKRDNEQKLAVEKFQSVLAFDASKMEIKELNDFIVSIELSSPALGDPVLIDLAPDGEGRIWPVVSRKVEDGQYKRLCPFDSPDTYDEFIDNKVEHIISGEAAVPTEKGTVLAASLSVELMDPKLLDELVYYEVMQREFASRMTPPALSPLQIFYDENGDLVENFDELRALGASKVAVKLQGQRRAALARVQEETPEFRKAVLAAKKAYEKALDEAYAIIEQDVGFVNMEYTIEVEKLIEQHLDNAANLEPAGLEEHMNLPNIAPPPRHSNGSLVYPGYGFGGGLYGL